jgi:hypothetical protein
MNLAQIALQQGGALLCGLAAIYFIEPTTSQGAILLLLIVLAAVNVLIRAWKWLAARSSQVPPKAGVQPPVADDGTG